MVRARGGTGQRTGLCVRACNTGQRLNLCRPKSVVAQPTPGVETQSAGLGNEADCRVSPEVLAWAELIFVMEKSHRNKLGRKFRKYLAGKRVICLDIPDEYDYMEPALVELLNRKVGRFLPAR